MIYRTFKSIIGLMALFTILFAGTASAAPKPPIGIRIADRNIDAISSQSLAQMVSEYGQISLSLDALGTVSATGKVQVEKPRSATVRKAYLMAATTGFENARLADGDVSIQGNGVAWAREIASGISSYNYWTDVTTIIKPHVDAAPAGIVDIELTERNSALIDGEILAVIFDDPNQTTDNTVLLYFGAQNVAGDSFTIDLGAPIDKDDPNLVLSYSLGISYSCQGSSNCGSIGGQHSTVDVNNVRLTTAAGGQDDGELSNGALITVGGIGDSTANPADPYALPTTARSDDELYDLRPFVNDGDRSIKIDTYNPSADDNILFAAVFLGATRSVGTIDVDITLYNNPTTAEARAPYEAIIRYFADGVYESSNGARKVGRVTFHVSGTDADSAEIMWVEKCHPNANVAGHGINGLHVNMCDIFKDGSGTGSDYNFLSDDSHQKGGGYTLAHEWGHFYFSLYDEYIGDTSYDSIFHFPHSTDKAVTNSIMNSQWNAMGGDNHWLNFSGSKNDTKETAQYRVYAASGWDTLVRPVADDPRDGERTSLPTRIYHEDLKDVAPAKDQESPIELPGEARSALKIVWPSTTATDVTTSLPTGLPYNIQLASILGQNISYPDPIVLLAFVYQDLPLTNLGVQGSVVLPSGSTLPVVFTDNGQAPDALAGDGLYSALIGYQTNGIYKVTVQFDNNAGQGQFVATSFQPSTDVNGEAVPLRAPVPTSDSFTLAKTIQIAVGNVVPDDHGDTAATASLVIANNIPVSGKIDRVGDIDVFRFTTLKNERTYVRITNTALGMRPRLRVFSSDGTTVLFEAAYDPTYSEYLFIPLSGIPPETVAYAEVSDTLGTASGGLYELSAGAKLASDVPYRYYVYLPYLTR